MSDRASPVGGTQSDASLPRKLLVTTTTLPRFNTDSEPRFVLDLSKELQKHFDVTILAPAAPGAALSERLEGVQVIRYRYAPTRSMETLAYPGAILPRLRAHRIQWILVPCLVWGLYKATRAMMLRNQYDCIHCHWIVPQGIVQSLISREFQVPYLLTVHGADVFGLDRAPFLGIKRIALKQASAVSAVSYAIREKLVKDGQLKLSDAHVEVIPMGVDLTRFDPGNRENHWAARIGLARPLILFVGRLAEKKGLAYLLHAMSREPLLSTGASLAVIGDGPLKEHLAQQAVRLGLSSRVRFLGSMHHHELATAYPSADIFCAPSIIGTDGDREGLPTVLCEAAASGLPAIATRVSGIPEVVRDGQTGFLVAQRDPDALSVALWRLVVSDTMRRSLGTAAREHAQMFSWQHIGGRYQKLIAQVISSRVPGIQ